MPPCDAPIAVIERDFYFRVLQDELPVMLGSVKVNGIPNLQRCAAGVCSLFMEVAAESHCYPFSWHSLPPEEGLPLPLPDA